MPPPREPLGPGAPSPILNLESAVSTMRREYGPLARAAIRAARTVAELRAVRDLLTATLLDRETARELDAAADKMLEAERAANARRVH